MNNNEFGLIDKKLSNDEITQSFVQLIKKTSVHQEADYFSKEKIIKIARALEKNGDISDRINDILNEKTENNQDSFRQLCDVTHYLGILDSKLQRDEAIEEGLANDFHQIVLKVNKAVESAAEFHNIPPWRSLIESIDKNIQLADPDYQKSKKPPPSLENYKYPIPLPIKNFAQMHGEAFILNSGLEGVDQGKMMEHLLACFSNFAFPLSAQGEKILKSLNGSLAIYNQFFSGHKKGADELFLIKDSFCSTIQAELKKLQPGESLLLPTGWASSSGGHAMYMEAIKQENNQFAIRLFNSGAGLENHPSILMQDVFKSFPFLEMIDVDESKIGDKNFLTALLEINFCSKDQEQASTNYSQKDLYDILWPWLGGTKVSRANETEKFIVPQRAGTCTWSSLMAILHVYLPKPELCRLQHDIHLTSLCDLFNQSKSNLVKDEETRLLLQKSAEQFCRELLTNYQEKIITLEELIAGKEAMQFILTALHQAKRQAEHEAANARIVDFKGIEGIPIKTGDLPLIPTTSIDVKKKPLSSGKLELPYSDFSWMDKPESIDSEMEKFRLYCQENLNDPTNQMLLQTSFNDFFTRLPLMSTGEDFWKTLPKDKTLKCLHEITLISELMFKHKRTTPHQRLNVQLHLLKGMATAHRLGSLSGDLSTLLAHKGNLPFRNIILDMIGTEFNGRPMHDANLYDAKSRGDLTLILDYLNHACNPTNRESNLFIIDDLESKFLVKFEKNEQFLESGYSDISELSYVKKLLMEDETKEKLFKKYPALKGKPYYQQIGYALTDIEGDILPQSFCDLKKMAILSKAINLNIEPGRILENGKLHLPIAINKNQELVQISSQGIHLINFNRELAFFGDIKNPVLNLLIQKSREKRTSSGETGALSEASVYSYKEASQFMEQFSNQIKEIPLPLEECKDLLCLMTGADYDGNDRHLDTQVSKTVSYFSSHLSKLKDPDYQAFISLLLFEANYLETFLRSTPSFAATLSTFVNHGHDTFLASGDIAGAAFFIELGRRLEGIVNEVGIQQESNRFPDPRQAIRKLLNIHSCTADEKVILYKQLAGSYLTHPKEPLEVDDVKEILSAVAYVKAHPTSALRNSSYLDQEADQVLVRYRKDIVKAIQTDHEGQDILRAVADRLDSREESAKSWDLTSRFPICVSKDGVLSFDLVNGCFYHRDRQISVLPKTITDNELFKNIFPRADYRVKESNGVYEFEDEEGHLTTCVQQRELIIQKELEKGVVCQYIPEKDLPNEIKDERQTVLGSLSLLHGKTYWKSLSEGDEQKILVLNKDRQIENSFSIIKQVASGNDLAPDQDAIDDFFDLKPTNDSENAAREKVLLMAPPDLLARKLRTLKQDLIKKDEITPSLAEKRDKLVSSLLSSPIPSTELLSQAKGFIRHYQQQAISFQVKSIEKIMPDGSRLSLADIYKEKTPFDFIKSFAGGSDVLLWKNGKGIPDLLEIPKLNLQFKLVKNGIRWEAHCIQMPGFQLSANQKIKGLPTFESALVLENFKGDRQALIPRLKIETEKQGALTTAFSLQRSQQDEPESYLVFNLDAKKGIHSSHREQQLFLAYLRLGKKEYGLAQETLKKSYSKVVPYTKSEQELLEWMLELHKDNKDADAKAAAVYLTALAQLIKSPAYKMPEDPALWRSIDDDYQTYVALSEHTTTFKLTKEEEISVIQTLMKLSENPNFTFYSQQIASARLASLEQGTLKDYALVVMPMASVQSKKVDSSIAKIDFETMMNQIEEAELADRNKILITRPAAAIVKHLTFFYKMAKDHHPDLALTLEFATKDVNANQQAINLLKAVWENPDLFPSAEQFTTIVRSKDWHDFEKDILTPLNRMDASPDSLPTDTNVNFVDLEKKPLSKPESLKSQAQTIKLSAPKESLKILTTKQLTSCFKEVGETGVRLSEQETKELKNAVDLTKDKGISEIKSQGLQKDIDYFCSAPPKKQAILYANKSEVLKTNLLIQQAEGQKALLGDMQALLNKANQVSPLLESGNIAQLERLATVKLEIELEDLVIGLIASDPSKLLEKNPALTPETIESLFSDLIAFYAAATRLQKVNRSLALVQDIEKRKNELDLSRLSTDQLYLNLSEKLFDELTSRRAYQVEKNPEYLILEYYQNLLMYPAQANDLNKMIHPTGNSHLILQKIMASGKTKLFLPILALKKADGDSLSMIVVPPFQLETSLKDMNALSGQVFHQTTHALHFDRQSKLSFSDLKNLNETLNDIRKNKEYVVITSKSLLCLYLKYYEMWSDYLLSSDNSNQMEEALIEMAKVLHTIKTKGKATLDEADLLLLCTQEVIFTLGNPIPLIDGHSELVGDIYESLFRHPELKSLLRGPQDNRKEEEVFTQEFYHQTIKPKILDNYWELAKTKGSALGKYLDSLSLDRQQLMRDYLLHESVEGFQFVESIADKQIRDFLAIVKEELAVSLPLTLNKRCDERFGFCDSPAEHLAVPFIANNTPSNASRFKKPNTILNYTIQAYLTKGVPVAILRNIVDKFKEQAMQELAVDPNLKISETVSYKGFMELCGEDESYHLMRVNDQDFERLSSQFQTNPTLLFGFLRRFIYPDVKMFPKELSANALTLVNMLGEAQGFTGTPWNSETYHKKLETIPEKGADGKTLAILWKRSKDHIHSGLSTSRFPDVLDELFALSATQENCQAIIDSGSLFNGVDNESVAKAILERLPANKKGVVFYKKQ